MVVQKHITRRLKAENSLQLGDEPEMEPSVYLLLGWLADRRGQPDERVQTLRVWGRRHKVS